MTQLSRKTVLQSFKASLTYELNFAHARKEKAEEDIKRLSDSLEFVKKEIKAQP